MHTYVYCGTVHNSKDLELTHMRINDRLDKENVAHTYHGTLCSQKKEEFVFFAGTWIKLKTIILSKLTQEQKTKHYMFSLISGCRTMKTHGHREGGTEKGVVIKAGEVTRVVVALLSLLRRHRACTCQCFILHHL